MDLSGSCAERHEGGWWFQECFEAYLNGLYYQESPLQSTGMLWVSWKLSFCTLKSSEMKIRPSDGEYFKIHVLKNRIFNTY